MGIGGCCPIRCGRRDDPGDAPLDPPIHPTLSGTPVLSGRPIDRVRCRASELARRSRHFTEAVTVTCWHPTGVYAVISAMLVTHPVAATAGHPSVRADAPGWPAPLQLYRKINHWTPHADGIDAPDLRVALKSHGTAGPTVELRFKAHAAGVDPSFRHSLAFERPVARGAWRQVIWTGAAHARPDLLGGPVLPRDGWAAHATLTRCNVHPRHVMDATAHLAFDGPEVTLDVQVHLLNGRPVAVAGSLHAAGAQVPIVSATVKLGRVHASPRCGPLHAVYELTLTGSVARIELSAPGMLATADLLAAMPWAMRHLVARVAGRPVVHTHVGTAVLQLHGRDWVGTFLHQHHRDATLVSL